MRQPESYFERGGSAVTLITPKLICCDEAGFTGNFLLDPDQHHFAYASHDLSLAEAECLLMDARGKFPVQMPELKANKLLKSAQGRRLIEYVLERMDGRYIATLYDKRLSLCSKAFEYIYEPALQANNKLFYDNNLHRFVAMFLYMHMLATPSTMMDLASEFETFMRSLDPADAPTLLGSPEGEDPQSPLSMVRRFARGFNLIIAQESQDLRDTPDQGKWVLDLTTTAVFSHLVAWGQRHALLEVVCDESKPLQSLADFYDVMINRHDHPEMDFGGKRRPLTWNMVGPLLFASSATHAGVQLADLVAGSAANAPNAKKDVQLRPIAARVMMHLHEDCIMPDMDVIDLNNDEAVVNFFILEALAMRADESADPLAGMAEMYRFARASLPEFRAGKFKST